jgi:hypothetical protein
MEHTEKYLQAKWVAENPDGYDERDVVDAKRYCNAYLDGYRQALRIHDVSGSFSSEKLEQAYRDGVRDALAKGYGTFDEENYR